MVINDHDFCDNHNADHVGDGDTNHGANRDADHDDNHDHYYSRVGNDNGDHIGNVANAHTILHCQSVHKDNHNSEISLPGAY